MFKKWMIFGVICFLLSLETSWGTTLYVPSDYPFIQQAIDVAVAGDTVLVEPGTYVENIDFKGKAIIVMSEDGAYETFIDGNELGSVVTCENREDEKSILDGFTITHGYADFGGGMYNHGCSPTVENCTFLENIAKYAGGGIWNEDSNPTVTHCTFSNCHAEVGGGMINYNKSSSILMNCTFIENTADDHGAGMWNHYSNPTMTHCTFFKNTANKIGGGIFNINSNPPMVDCKFEKNSATDYGGGVANYESNPTMTDCQFLENHGHSGGGMDNEDSSNLTLIRCAFIANEAAYGAGMRNSRSEMIITDCAFSANKALYEGGGMHNYECSNSTIIDCIFAGNSVTSAFNIYSGGGGILNYQSCMTITNCAFNGNWVSGNNIDACGGGIHNSYSSPSINNCTFYHNEAGTGGGMCNWEYSDPTITNCTFNMNSAVSGGGMHIESACNPIVTNTIFWDDYAIEGPEIWLGSTASPSTLSISHSNVEGGQSSVDVHGSTLIWGSGMIDSDPLFVDSFNNDCHLTFHSPCKDTGANYAVSTKDDFEDDPRIADGTVDMGVDEFYSHLYCTGDFTPGGSIEAKLVGSPATKPVGLFYSTGSLPSPMPTQWGDFWLQAPWFLIPLVPIPGDGVLMLPATIPATPPAPYDLPMQGLIGLNSNSLTNLCVLEVR